MTDQTSVSKRFASMQLSSVQDIPKKLKTKIYRCKEGIKMIVVVLQNTNKEMKEIKF
jgi:hypothetical protein